MRPTNLRGGLVLPGLALCQALSLARCQGIPFTILPTLRVTVRLGQARQERALGNGQVWSREEKKNTYGTPQTGPVFPFLVTIVV